MTVTRDKLYNKKSEWISNSTKPRSEQKNRDKFSFLQVRTTEHISRSFVRPTAINGSMEASNYIPSDKAVDSSPGSPHFFSNQDRILSGSVSDHEVYEPPIIKEQEEQEEESFESLRSPRRRITSVESHLTANFGRSSDNSAAFH